jgi:hypothetical protein
MAAKKLKFASTTNMFGTKINLQTRDKSYDQVLVEGFNPVNPLKNQNKKVTGGYLFRSPNIRNDDWPAVFSSLANAEDQYSLTAELTGEDDKVKIDAWIRFVSQSDAAIFAWTNVDKWQKWSDALEKEERKDAKTRGKPLKATVDKNGNIKVKVKVTTLGT